jgi:hypothetical protein
MVDADEEGYLLQILQNQFKIPTLFLKYREWEPKVLAQVQALFESIERTGIARNAIKTRFTLCEKYNELGLLLLCCVKLFF